MKPVRAVLLTLLTLFGMVAGVSLAAGVTTSSPTTSTGTQQSTDAVDATLGSQISAFMQSNAAETGGAVESGMWAATFDGTTNESAKTQLVTGHVDTLQKRLDQIENRKQELVERRKAGEISRLKYQSEMSAVIGRYDALVDAINETERRAEATGTNTSELDELRANSKEVTGPEVAAVARNLSVDAPGLEKTNRTDPAPGNVSNGNGAENAGGNGANASDAGVPGNGKANGKGNAGVNASVNGNGNANGRSAINASAAVNATANVTDGVETATGTLDGTLTDPTEAPGNPNGTGAPAGRTQRGNGESNRSNASNESREPATGEPTRVVTSTVAATHDESADVPTTADVPSASADASSTAGDGEPSTTTADPTGDGADANGTVVPTTGFAAR